MHIRTTNIRAEVSGTKHPQAIAAARRRYKIHRTAEFGTATGARDWSRAGIRELSFFVRRNIQRFAGRTNEIRGQRVRFRGTRDAGYEDHNDRH
jgi:hypothetical protein